ncbi:MAG: GerMN domain-containing protein [Treponema sp.]|nr:GerMN domain-containing protein [Treponema sp.]
MNAKVDKILSHLGGFFGNRRNRRCTYIAVICLIALGDFLHSGLARRTFVFYATRGGAAAVEDRFLRRSGDRETDIRRYVDEALLGPKAQETLALPFVRGTRVQSVMYRDGVAFVDLTDLAVMPPPDGGSVFHSLLTLNKGIRRNFSFVKDVRLFIGGNQVFFEEFREIFADRADNSRA